MHLYENDHIWIEREPSEIPWLKLFPKAQCRELSDCPHDLRLLLWETLDTIERTMLEYYRPEKINIASFGNYLPRVHLHIMARFKEDSHFPEPMWGTPQRTARVSLPPFDDFVTMLRERL